ncbi:MAG: acetate--CoA ligase family protein [Spirochaetota bacterium]
MLDSLFSPKSVAVVGASEIHFKWGTYISSNILDGKFKGRYYPVNPNIKEVFGFATFPSVVDIPEPVDLVFITTPAPTVMQILQDCVQKKINNIVMITSGFSETGPEGVQMEKEIIAFAQKHNLNIVGPNTMGIVNTHCSLYATGAITRPKSGGISIIAQSGNLGYQIMEWAESEDIGISKFVGSGNEAVLKIEDYLTYFKSDSETKVVLMYIEGVDDGRVFVDVAKDTSLHKPIIALKAGRTEIGSKAAASHTGAMAGSFSIFKGVMNQTGIVFAESPRQLLTLSAAFDSFPLPKGNKIGIITLGGGWGVVTADECAERGLRIPELPQSIKDELDRRLPPFWSKGNPVDLVGQPDFQLYKDAVELIVAHEAFDAVIVLGIIGSKVFAYKAAEAVFNLGKMKKNVFDDFVKLLYEHQNEFLDRLIELMDVYDKPILPVSLSKMQGDETVHSSGGKHKVVIYDSPEEAVLCLSKMYQYYNYVDKRSTVYA